MHPLVLYLMGEAHPQGKRIVNVQKCVRTGDIEEVGDTTHLTFFEMLGNWSLGDYFKEDSIAWSWEFLTSKKWLKIDPEKLYITVYEGDDEVPKDEESIKIWQEQFKSVDMEAIEGERIFPLGREDNWWGPAGKTGPCGPDTEIFYDTGKKECDINCQPGCSCGKYVEIWNNVFMEYNKLADGTYEPLKQKNVDTGMGVERTVAVLNGTDSVFDTDELKSIIEVLEINSNKSYKDEAKAFHIIVDHFRAAVMMIADGVTPSNAEQGYILRRLIRRAIRYGIQITDKSYIHDVVMKIVDISAEQYPEVGNGDDVMKVISNEEEKFAKTLTKGLKKFNDLVASEKAKDRIIDAKNAFDLFQTYGFPLEMTQELAGEHNLDVDEKGFYKEFSKHQEVSRTDEKFAGGLADHSEMSTKYHTTTHLLHAGLRKVLGDHVEQKGSNITEKRMRFDFSHPDKMTEEEIKQVEDFVNDAIKKDHRVSFSEMTVEEAKKKGALGLFESKYGDKVKLYSIGDISHEICGGPHVENTGVLGAFKISKEQSASAGIRRIKAVLG